MGAPKRALLWQLHIGRLSLKLADSSRLRSFGTFWPPKRYPAMPLRAATAASPLILSVSVRPKIARTITMAVPKRITLPDCTIVSITFAVASGAFKRPTIPTIAVATPTTPVAVVTKKAKSVRDFESNSMLMVSPHLDPGKLTGHSRLSLPQNGRSGCASQTRRKLSRRMGRRAVIKCTVTVILIPVHAGGLSVGIWTDRGGYNP